MEFSEEWLARKMDTTQTGTSPSAFREVLASLGVSAAEIEGARIGDIRKFVATGFPVIVSWYYRGDGHFSVVTGFTADGRLCIFEPLLGKIIRVRIGRFLSAWYDPCNNTERWMLAMGVRVADASKHSSVRYQPLKWHDDAPTKDPEE